MFGTSLVRTLCSVARAADLRSLARLIPAESRLVIDPGAAAGAASQPAADALSDGTALELVSARFCSPLPLAYPKPLGILYPEEPHAYPGGRHKP